MKGSLVKYLKTSHIYAFFLLSLICSSCISIPLGFTQSSQKSQPILSEEAYQQKANELYSKGLYQETIDALTQAYKISKKSAYLVNIALIHQEFKEYELAVQFLKK